MQIILTGKFTSSSPSVNFVAKKQFLQKREHTPHLPLKPAQGFLSAWIPYSSDLQ